MGRPDVLIELVQGDFEFNPIKPYDEDGNGQAIDHMLLSHEHTRIHMLQNALNTPLFN